LFIPGNNSGPITTTLGKDERFVQSPGEVWGQLQTRDPISGEWSSQRAQGIRNGANFEVLTQDQLARLQGPLTTPITPPRPSGPPPLPGWVDNNRPNPGYTAAPAGPTTLVNPAAPQPTAAELIIERNRAEQQRFRNALVDEAKKIDPNFDATGFDAHHGIPLTDYPRLNGLRDQLAKWGVDLNDASINGVLLPRTKDAPGTTSHQDTQNNPAYSEEILDRFRDVKTKEEALDVLGKIRQDLRDGNFVEPKTRGD
jgi:hypothetical protein